MPVPPGPLALLRCRARDVLSTAEGEEPLGSQPDSYCCRFCPRPGSLHVLASADEDGTIKLWDTRPDAQQSVIHTEEAHTNAIYELDWSRDGRHLLSAAGDRAIKLWDVGQLMTPLAEFRRHSRTVKTVTFLPDDPCVFASGGRDGVIEVWDMRVTKQISHEIRPGRVTADGRWPSRRGADVPDTITALAFRDDTYLLSAASGASTVSVWDLRKLYSTTQRQPLPVHRLDSAEPGRGVVSMATDRERGQLYVSRINDVIQRYSLTNWTQDHAGTFSGQHCGSFYVRCAVSPDGTRLASGGSDRAALLWDTATAGPPAGRLAGHADEVTCVAWSADSRTLATVSDDLHLRLWRSDLYSEDTGDDDSTLVMERLERPTSDSDGGGGGGRAPTPLLLYNFRRETGTRWRPARGSSEVPQTPSAAPSPAPSATAAVVTRQGARQTQQAASAGSSGSRKRVTLAGWLKTAARRQDTAAATAAAAAAAAAAASPTSPRRRQAEREGAEGEGTPTKRRPLPLPLVSSPSKMCFSPGSPVKSAQLTPISSPFKRYSVLLSPSKAGSSARPVTPSGSGVGSSSSSPSCRSPGRVGVPAAAERQAGTPTGSAASSTAGSPRRPVLAAVNDERVISPAACSDPLTPAGSGAGRGAVSSPHTPRTPARSSPRKAPAKVLFSCSPACVTPESSRRRPADLYRSPTADLPNLVVDGRSPHRPPAARPRRQPRADWLTCLSQRKRAQASPAAAPPVAKRSRRQTGPRKGTPG